MFEDTLEEWYDEGWLLLIFMFLVKSYIFVLDGTRHAPVEARVNFYRTGLVISLLGVYVRAKHIGTVLPRVLHEIITTIYC